MKSVEQMKGNKTIKAGGSTAPQMSEWTGWMDGYFEILAAERLRLVGFDNRLIIDCFANVVNILKW